MNQPTHEQLVAYWTTVLGYSEAEVMQVYAKDGDQVLIDNLCPDELEDCAQCVPF